MVMKAIPEQLAQSIPSHLKHGDRCLGCLRGQVYNIKRPDFLTTLACRHPRSGHTFELEKLRRILCREIVTAPALPSKSFPSLFLRTATISRSPHQGGDRKPLVDPFTTKLPSTGHAHPDFMKSARHSKKVHTAHPCRKDNGVGEVVLVPSSQFDMGCLLIRRRRRCYSNRSL